MKSNTTELCNCYECTCDEPADYVTEEITIQDVDQICDLCGTYAGELIEGVCQPCRHRLGLDDPSVLPAYPLGAEGIIPKEVLDELIEAQETPACTRQLAAVVRENLREFFDLPQETYEHIIQEALFQAARQLQNRHIVELEYLGHFYPVCHGLVRFEPTHELKEGIPNPPIKDIIKKYAPRRTHP